jgi:5-methylcytosine-specific restriction endonuclease McrA
MKVSRPEGNNSYKNVVAACRQCNNRKNDTPVEDFLRLLIREDFLSEEDHKQRMGALKDLRAGVLKPTLD